MRPSHATWCSLLISSSAGWLLACGDVAPTMREADPAGTTGGSAGSAGTGGMTLGGSSGSAGTGGSLSTGGVAGSAGSTAGTTSGGASTGGTAGSGGQSGGGSGGGAATDNPMGCLPAFEEVCGPEIVFNNEDPADSGNFTAVISDVEGTMKWAACTVCSIMYRSADEVPRTHETVTFVIDDHDGVAYAGGSEIHLSTNHIKNYGNPDSALVEFKGVMVHETAHLYQVNGGSSDGALIEGMADFVRIRAGLYEQGRRGGGGSWGDAYTTSGFFFSWLAGPCDYHGDGHPQNDLDIGYRINAVMPQGKSAVQTEIETTFGTGIDALWTQYQEAI
jgi:hypothetical protein